jgi:CRP-like cAMP-binding protein
MDDDLILKLASIAGLRFCQADETVFEQDAKADYFYLVLHGLVEVRIRNKNYTD